MGRIVLSKCKQTEFLILFKLRLMRIAIVCIILCAAFYSPSVFSLSFQGSASASILQLISITENSVMSYGSIMTDGQADVITISPDGEISSTNGTTMEGDVSAASFNIAGTPLAAISISFQDGQLSGSGQSMTLNNFTHDAGASALFDNAGVLNFNVGADLSINANQVSGSYAGNYIVNVDYN